MRTFKVLSLLLSYPSPGLASESGALKAVLAEERLLSQQVLREIGALIDHLAAEDLLDAQERYVFLFDRTRSLSLHLFEHVHGESRDRGQAMVDLLNLYRKKGLDVWGGELPDYLPLFLEYLSLIPLEEAKAFLGEPLHILSALRTRLEQRKSPYAAVFRALEDLAGQAADHEKVEALLAGEPDPHPLDKKALDDAWKEAEVRFGPGAEEKGCPRMKNVVEAMARDVAGESPSRKENG